MGAGHFLRGGGEAGGVGTELSPDVFPNEDTTNYFSMKKYFIL